MALIDFPSSIPLHFPHVSIFESTAHRGKPIFFSMLVGCINGWVGFFNKCFCFGKNLISPEKWLFIKAGLIVLSLHLRYPSSL